MLIVTIELAPKGNLDAKRHLGTAIISNDGTGDSDTGNYRVELSKWGRPSTIWMVGNVHGFPRRKLGPWDLLYRVLAATVGERSHEPPA